MYSHGEPPKMMKFYIILILACHLIKGILYIAKLHVAMVQAPVRTRRSFVRRLFHEVLLTLILVWVTNHISGKE